MGQCCSRSVAVADTLAVVVDRKDAPPVAAAPAVTPPAPPAVMNPHAAPPAAILEALIARGHVVPCELAGFCAVGAFAPALLCRAARARTRATARQSRAASSRGARAARS